jgi:hypothetical protein
MAEHVRGLCRAFVVREPDEAGEQFVAALADRLRMVGYEGDPLQIVEMPDGLKDPGELHAVDPARFKSRFRAACRAARPLTAGPAGSCWQAAITAQQLLAADPGTDEMDILEPRHLAVGCLTLWFSPRGLGKTHAAHAMAVKPAAAGRRVLLLDRDNSGAEITRRLRGWGAETAPSLKVLTRDQAPSLGQAPAGAISSRRGRWTICRPHRAESQSGALWRRSLFGGGARREPGPRCGGRSRRGARPAGALLRARCVWGRGLPRLVAVNR